MFASTLSIPAASPAGFLRNSPVPSRRRATSAVVRPRAVAAVERRSARSTSSLYEVLRIDPKATMTEIKTAYRSLAKVYHPDLAVTASSSSSDGSDFIEIHNAYETLSDPAARAVYDSSLFGNGRRRTASFAYSDRGGFYPTRRWETDQCW